MNRSTTLTILKFAIVIMLFAIVLFFITDVEAPTFIAICLTMLFCTLAYVFGVFRLRSYEDDAISKRTLLIALCSWLAVVAVCAAIKVIIVSA